MLETPNPKPGNPGVDEGGSERGPHGCSGAAQAGGFFQGPEFA